MNDFAGLFRRLDETTRTNEKIAAMREYFSEAEPDDAVWALYFLSGRKVKRLVSSPKLRAWTIDHLDIPEWLLEESYEAVGDMAETITLLLPEQSEGTDRPLHYWVEERLLPMREMDEEEQRSAMIAAWGEMTTPQRFLWNKMITGSFRVGVSQRLVVRALAEMSGIDPAVITHRLMGSWEPTPATFTRLFDESTDDADRSRPYPFFLAYPIEGDPGEALGDRAEWQVEWKWDGIRGQLVRRDGETYLWSRGEELVSDRYPEIIDGSSRLPDGTVLDGEILPWKDGRVLPFGELQRRIGRKTVGRKLLTEVPVIFLCYDLMEHAGEDLRTLPMQERRRLLDKILASSGGEALSISPIVESDSWEELATLRQESRGRGVEGFMIKRLDSPYRVGRVRGDWWKWKVEPYTIDAVMIYAQRGHGRRASLYTDYTFGLWQEGELVPFAKAYSGLTDEEIRKVDAWVRRNTIERFGPVRRVKTEHVFELAFEGIRESTRHKSGIAVRFPRILRWRHDKSIEEADSIETVRALIDAEEEGRVDGASQQ